MDLQFNSLCQNTVYFIYYFIQNKTHLKFRYVIVIDQLNLKSHIINEKKNTYT